ncbi:MAG: hypothetical protein WC524_00895 [Candidatus Aminicenantales bacterium]|jgi:hypothetical protein
MENHSKGTEEIFAENPDVALIIDIFKEIERVYLESLEAMGIENRQMPSVKNSSETTISFKLSISSSGD